MDQANLLSSQSAARASTPEEVLRRVRALPLLLALVTIALGLVYLAVIPPWGGPDEPRHVEYVRLLNERGRLVGYDDIDPRGMEEIIRSMDAANYWRWGVSLWKRTTPGELPRDFTAIWGEGAHQLHQPPLAYLLYLVPYKLAANHLTAQLYAMRLLSILLNVVVVLAAYATGRELFRGDPTMALALPVFVMLLPQHLFLHSTVMNDHLVEAALAWLIALVTRTFRLGFSAPRALGILLCLAVGLAAKRSALYAAPILAFAFVAYALLHWGGGHLTGTQKSARLALTITGLSGCAIAFILLWNWTGVHQPAWQDYLVRLFFFLPSQEFPFQIDGRIVQPAAFALYASYLKYIFISTWGHFGWMNITLGVGAYWGFAILTAIALLGLVVFWLRDFPALLVFQRATLLIFAVSVLVAFAMILALQVRVWDLGWGGDPQGRYLFPVLIPLATLFLLGLRTFFPRSRYVLWFGLLTGGMVVYNAIVLSFFIIPFYRA